MVIRQTESESRTAYHSKMLRSRNMDHLLRVNERIVNGDKYNYYDITSKLSLKQFLGHRSLSMSDMTPLMNDLQRACREIENYLLDPSRLVLDPEMIFYSHSKEKYYFLYNISTSVEESENDIGLLMDYLLDRADGGDEAVSDLIYNLYEQYEKGVMDVWRMIETYNEYTSDPSVDQTDTFRESDPVPVPVPTPIPVPVPDSLPPAATGTPMRKNPVPLIIAGLGILGVAACLAIRMMFKLEPDEKLIWTAAIAAAGIISAGGIIGFVITLIKNRSEDPQPDSTAIYTPAPDQPDIHMQDFIASPAMPVKPAVTGSKQERLNAESEDVYAPPIEGQTVFFDGASESGTYKLYALDRKNKTHIELDHLPVTIGKLNGYVDYVIDHPSISRMHARLDRQGDRLMLSDLNSTNGVFLNGMRLSPNEVREIEEGDEIRFGSLNYCLRRCS